MRDSRFPNGGRIGALASVGIASVLILLGMFPLSAAWTCVFALAATVLAVLLMLLPTEQGPMRAGLSIAMGSLVLGLLAVFGHLDGGGPLGALHRLALMLVFFWFLPMIVLSFSYARRFETENRDAESLEDES